MNNSHQQHNNELTTLIRTELASIPFSTILRAIGPWIIILFGLYVLSDANYLLFHSFSEIFSIVVSCGVFLVAWNSRAFLHNQFFLFVGIAFVFVAGVDTVHMLAYKGMGVFPQHDANLPTQLWIAARYLQALSLLIAPFTIRRKPPRWGILAAYTLITGALFASIFWWGIFPDAYVEGTGLTSFKIISEYVIVVILAASVLLLARQRQHFEARVFLLLTGAMILTIFAELAFTQYISVYGTANLVGHFFKIVAFFLIYRALINTALSKPYAVIFRELKNTEEKLRRAHLDLNERVKELSLLYEVAVLINDPNLTWHETLRRIVNQIPHGWQYPEETAVRLTIQGQSHASEGFVETDWTLSQPISTNSEMVGVIEVAYTGNGPHTFLPEEHELVESIAEQLAQAVEKQRTADRLRESQRRLRAIFDNALNGILLADDEGRYLDANPAACKILGYSRDELLQMGVADITPMPTRENIDQMWEDFISQGQLTGEFLLRGKEGNLIQTAFQAAANIVPGVHMSIMEDTTEQIEAEQALQASEERYRTLFNTMPVGVVYQSANGEITMANPAAERILGLTLDQMQGRTSHDPRWHTIREDGSSFPGDEHPSMVALRTGKPVKGKMMGVFNPKDDAHHWIVLHAIPQFREGEDTPYQVYTTFEDITEQRESDEAYHSLVENSLQGLFIIQEGLAVFANRMIEEITGYTVEECFALSRDDVRALVYEGDRERVWDYHQARIAGEPAPDHYECRIVCKEGLIRWVEVRATLIEYQRKPAVQVALVDITERKQAEIELKRKHRRVQLLAARLTETEEAERQRLARELHDQVGQELSALGINLNMINAQLESDPDAASARIRDALALVKEVTQKTRQVMDDLRPPVLDQYGLVAAIRWYGNKFAERHDISVTIRDNNVELQPTPEVETHLFRIVQEALTNVARHAQAGHVNITFTPLGTSFNLEIADDGVGFSPEDTSNQTDSTHWGTLIMQERARLIGRQCRIESQPGAGTQVIVEISK